MNIEHLREYCLSKKGVTEEFPFDDNTLVFKVQGKMFALTSLAKPMSVNVKCNPEKAIELRHEFEAIEPGYHMSKLHWNTIFFNLDVNDKLLFTFVDDSYNLVVSKLPKNVRNELL